MRKIFRSKKATTLQAEVQVLEELTKEKTQTTGDSTADCSDGERCQRLVSEEELPKLLAEGWKYVATLPSGKCVVEMLSFPPSHFLEMVAYEGANASFK